MDADDGHQSMRIGVQVENASQAKACGVELTIGDKTVKIATDGDGETVLKGDKIYEYDEAKDTILYTAVITNIPSTAFSTAISAKGSATPVEEGDAVVSDAVAKSVTDVVDGIKEKLPDVQMLDDGTLVNGVIASFDGTKSDAVDSLKAHGTQNAFFLFAKGWENPADWETTMYNSCNKDAAAEYSADEQATKFTTDTGSGRALTYQTTNAIDTIFSIKVKSDDTTANFQLQNFLDTNGGPTSNVTGEYQTITEKVSLAAYNARILTLSKPGTYYVKSCKLYRPLTSDDVTMHLPKETVTLSIVDAVGGGTGNLSDGTPAPAGSVEKNDDGSILIKNHIFVCIPLDKTYPAGSKLKVTVYGECAQTGLRGWCAGGNSDGGATSNQQAPMNFGTAYTYTTTNNSTYFEIKVPSHNSPVFTTLRITKVELTDLT